MKTNPPASSKSPSRRKTPRIMLYPSSPGCVGGPDLTLAKVPAATKWECQIRYHRPPHQPLAAAFGKFNLISILLRSRTADLKSLLHKREFDQGLQIDKAVLESISL